MSLGAMVIEADELTRPAGNPPRENLIRAMPRGYELRHSEDGMPTMFGHFARFDEWTEIDSLWEGRFMERVARGAFRKTFKENRAQMRVLFNHGGDPSIGDKVLGPIEDLREDDEGAFYEVPLFDTSYTRDLLPGLEAGQYGASFRFRVMREDIVQKPGASDHNPEGLPERTIKEAQVMEFGPVTFPAYAGATSGVRSLTDEFIVGRFVSEPKRLRELVEQHVPATQEKRDETTVEAPSDPTPANATSEDERRDDVSETTNHSEAETSTEVDTNPNIDRLGSVEDCVARIDEIRKRQQEIDSEHAGKAFPTEIQDEWDALVAEEPQVAERKQHFEERRRILDRQRKDPNAVEKGTPEPFSTRTGPKVENIYDLSEYRKAASGPEQETQLLRDGMKRSLDVTNFPHPRAVREDAQEAVSKTVDKLDRNGALAAYFLATASDNYRQAFGKWALSGGLAPMTSAEQNSIQQARAYEERAFTLGSTGLPVPYQLDPTVIPISNFSVNPYRAISRVEQIVVDEWRGATSAGITAAYAAEATEASDNTPTLAQPTVSAERAQAFVPFSIEVHQDWGVIEAEMAREIQDAKDDLEATKFTLGTGTNEPFGLITGATTLVITTTTGAFVVADLYKLEEALPPRFRARASVVGNRFIYNKVRQFDTAGGSGVWLDGLQPGLANQVPTPGAIGPRVIGYPAHEVSAMDAALTTGSEILVMGDFRYFIIVDRVGMSIDLVPHLVGTNHRPTGQRGIYAFWRNGSKVLNAAAFRTLQT